MQSKQVLIAWQWAQVAMLVVFLSTAGEISFRINDRCLLLDGSMIFTRTIIIPFALLKIYLVEALFLRLCFDFIQTCGEVIFCEMLQPTDVTTDELLVAFLTLIWSEAGWICFSEGNYFGARFILLPLLAVYDKTWDEQNDRHARGSYEGDPVSIALVFLFLNCDKLKLGLYLLDNYLLCIGDNFYDRIGDLCIFFGADCIEDEDAKTLQWAVDLLLEAFESDQLIGFIEIQGLRSRTDVVLYLQKASCHGLPGWALDTNPVDSTIFVPLSQGHLFDILTGRKFHVLTVLLVFTI